MSIITDYESGMSVEKIANARGIYKKKVWEYLTSEGVKMRAAHRHGGTIFPEKAKMVVALLHGGQYTFTQIAKRIGVSYTFVKLRSAEMRGANA